MLEKKTKYLQKHFIYFQILEFYFQTGTNFKFNSNIYKCLKKHDYNILTFEVHVNKS